jgi:hypothetical protein
MKMKWQKGQLTDCLLFFGCSESKKEEEERYVFR